jgi:hypothetical protein
MSADPSEHLFLYGATTAAIFRTAVGGASGCCDGSKGLSDANLQKHHRALQLTK